MPIFKKINRNFFKRWSPAMAYSLGYFAADGCMYINKRGAHFIEFQSIDKHLLELLKNSMSSAHKISVRLAAKGETLYRLQIGSKKIFKDLLKLGFMPAKSKVIDFPSIPTALIAHFVRGYFDGDGHVSISSYHRKDRPGKLSRTIMSGFTSGSKIFLKKLLIALKQHGSISGGLLI